MNHPHPLTRFQRLLIFACALLAWLCAGLLLALPPLAARDAVLSMGVIDEALRGRWFSWMVCAFLLGAACGGLCFGWCGDRLGRSKALGLSVVTYGMLSGACYFAVTPWQLLGLWFLACMGVGGVWPNGVSLASEAFPGVSRPWLSGAFGTAANLGLMALAFMATRRAITAEDWRWVTLVCAAPAVLGLFILAVLPESPLWLARRGAAHAAATSGSEASWEVFRPPLLKLTILGVLLATVPMAGNWGATNWLTPWAKKVQDERLAADPDDDAARHLSADTQWMKSCGAAIGGLLGGFMATFVGRRVSYFLMSVGSLASGYYIFHALTPSDESFLPWVFAQGIIGTLFFGWMPLYFPELFPTRVRATGTGVAFNWGRVTTAACVLAGGELLRSFDGDYAQVGRITCLIYAFGTIVICFAPDTSRTNLDDLRASP